MSRNSGIFWAMLETSLLVGNTYYYFQFADVDVSPSRVRMPNCPKLAEYDFSQSENFVFATFRTFRKARETSLLQS